MGSESHRSGMQGFGYSPGRKESGKTQTFNVIHPSPELNTNIYNWKAFWCVSRHISLSRSGGGTLLDKIQKAAEVVASAVLPPTEHPGIRLHDNHYHAVVAPSATVEMAVPACAYNIPSHSHRGEPCTRL